MKMENTISLWNTQTLVNMSLCVYMHMYGMKYCKNCHFLSFQSRMKWWPGQTVYTTTQTSQQPRTPRRMVSVCLCVEDMRVSLHVIKCVCKRLFQIHMSRWMESQSSSRQRWMEEDSVNERDAEKWTTAVKLQLKERNWEFIFKM